MLSNEFIEKYKRICYNYIINKTVSYVKEVNVKNKKINKNIYLRYIPMSLAAAFILFFAVKNALYPAEGQEVELWYLILKTLPTLVTLVVQILLIKASRYAFLLGGCNSVIYSVVYFMEGLTFSAIYALLISFSLQVYSFFHWRKNTESGKVALRWLSAKSRVLTAVLAMGMWAICYFWLSGYMVMRIPLLDTIVFSLGIVCTVLSSVRYIESQYVSFVSCVVSLIMWIILAFQNPSNINYVIIGIYNLYCVGQAAVNWTLIYIGDKNKNMIEK